MTNAQKSVRSPGRLPSTDTMKTPDDVAAMRRLHALGWGVRRIAHELGISPNTVRRHLRAGEWRSYQTPERESALDPHQEWLQARFLQHRGNAAVVHEELRRELGVTVSLRTVERAVESHRDELRAEAVATTRFETPPGQQMQIDFGQRRVRIGDEDVVAHLCILTLGYSRRTFAIAYACERQAQWLEGIEAAFQHFGGTPVELLMDNARALVTHHDAATREVTFNETFRGFCEHWGVRPRACAPYRARTKGKDERAVQYVGRNAIAGRTFRSWEDFNAHLVRWSREIADVRIHGTTGDRPIDRFERAERSVLKPLRAVPFLRVRELFRRVHTDGCVEVDTNHYSVPWRLIGKRVVVRILDGKMSVLRGDTTVACHDARPPSRARIIDRTHLAGVVRQTEEARLTGGSAQVVVTGNLQRPLSEYDDSVGGAL
ncbi:MAG: IS21 family transposase [bacterium]|nr:IS21 family transposase [bacterium]